MKVDTKNLIKRIEEGCSDVEVHEVVFELEYLTQQRDETRLTRLRNAYLACLIKKFPQKAPERLISDMNYELFHKAVIGDEFVRAGPSSGACRFMPFDPYSDGPVTRFYRDTTGYNPETDIERAREEGFLCPNSEK